MEMQLHLYNIQTRRIKQRKEHEKGHCREQAQDVQQSKQAAARKSETQFNQPRKDYENQCIRRW